MLNDTRIDATIPVVDLNRARRFYRDTLKLKEITPSGVDPKAAEDNAMFQVGDCSRFLLFRRPHRSKAEHTVAVFTVKDLEKTMRELRDQGVRFERYDLPNLKTDERGIVEEDGMKAAWFKDSEGNILGVSEMVWLN
jgi:catechol 2,3-dioxygenase-like lactoylglutathione lyase family enzyme